MRGLWIDEGGVRLRTDLPDLEPASATEALDETTVRVLRAGVCATDLALARGYMNFRGIPGHEFVGEALDGPLTGERVVGEINAGCGTCPLCLAGDARHCPERTVLGILARSGAFAEALRLPTRNLHAVPANVPDRHAVFAEPLAAAFEIVEQLAPRPGTRALVLGDGRLGLLCAQVLARAGLEVECLGRHPERGAFLEHAPGPGSIRHRGAVAEGTHERYPLVVEATGDPQAFAAALVRVEARGHLVLKTTSETPASLDLAPLVVDEITLVGSRCGPFEPALRALASGELVLDPMIHGTLPLAEGVLAFEQAARSGTLKIQVTMNPDED